jgi:hypothetical protein
VLIVARFDVRQLRACDGTLTFVEMPSSQVLADDEPARRGKVARELTAERLNASG